MASAVCNNKLVNDVKKRTLLPLLDHIVELVGVPSLAGGMG